MGTGDATLICTSIGGVQKATLRVDPKAQYLSSIQEELARFLNVSPARLRLIKSGATRLPTVAENRMTLSELFADFSTHDDALVESVDEGRPCCDSSTDRKGANRNAHFYQNELSVSSVSTCATLADLTHKRLDETPARG